MTVDKEQVRRQFNRHAATYDRHARLQHEMAERLVERLGAAEPAAILELGCGTGRLTELLARRFPEARIVAVDLAENMVAAARERLGDAAGVELVVGDAEREPWAGERFDLVVSSATVQWLARPEETMAALAAALAPGGRMLHSTFGPKTLRELFAVLERVETARGLEPRRHGLPLLPAARWEELLRGLGLAGVEARSRLVRRTYPSCRACLAEIRGAGAAHAPAGATGPAVLAEAARLYDRDVRLGDGVFATYELVELAARRREATL